jgi:hypothetical protein
VDALVDALVWIGSERWVGVVVHAGAGELAGVATDVDGEAGLGPQRAPTPSHDVVLQCARAAVVGDGAVLERDAAAVGEEPLVERDCTSASVSPDITPAKYGTGAAPRASAAARS